MLPTLFATDVSQFGTSEQHKVHRDATERKRKRKSKRKRESVGADTSCIQRSPLEGILLAVSTFDGIENETRTTRDISYTLVVKSCREARAMASGKVHNRVRFLICTPSAVVKATQRVRKAIRKRIPLIDSKWVQRCLQENKRVDQSEFSLNHLATVQTGAADKPNAPRPDGPTFDSSGWSEPFDLGCCCVCHENGTLNCGWCVECSINKQAKKAKSIK
jgi:hypothetical protein